MDVFVRVKRKINFDPLPAVLLGSNNDHRNPYAQRTTDFKRRRVNHPLIFELVDCSKTNSLPASSFVCDDGNDADMFPLEDDHFDRFRKHVTLTSQSGDRKYCILDFDRDEDLQEGLGGGRIIEENDVSLSALSSTVQAPVSYSSEEALYEFDFYRLIRNPSRYEEVYLMYRGLSYGELEKNVMLVELPSGEWDQLVADDSFLLDNQSDDSNAERSDYGGDDEEKSDDEGVDDEDLENNNEVDDVEIENALFKDNNNDDDDENDQKLNKNTSKDIFKNSAHKDLRSSTAFNFEQHKLRKQNKLTQEDDEDDDEKNALYTVPERFRDTYKEEQRNEQKVKTIIKLQMARFKASNPNASVLDKLALLEELENQYEQNQQD